MTRRVNVPYGVSAVLLAATACIHAFAGGAEINAPVQASDLAPILRAVIAVIWHAITALAVILAGTMAWCAWRPNMVAVLMVLAINVAFAVLFLGFGYGQLGSLWPMPQWIIFITISAVIVWGITRQITR